MGVWGAGLYSGDFAQDLRSTIRAISRLPYDGDKLIEIVCQTEPAAANSPDDEDHSIFWLVAADQFVKRGIASDRARETALKIIEEGSDIAKLEKLGMDPAGLRKRRRVLEELRAKIAAPPSPKPRPVLKQPQAYLMEVGDVLVYPACEGKSINPYFASKERDRSWKGQDGWSAVVIVNRGRAFEFDLVSSPDSGSSANGKTHARGFARRPDLEIRPGGNMLAQPFQKNGAGENRFGAHRRE